MPNYLLEKVVVANQVHSENTRYAKGGKMFWTFCYSKKWSNSIFNAGFKMHDELPNVIKSLKSVNIFKVKCIDG